MKPKFSASPAKKQTPAEPVFDFYADVATTVGQIVSDLREEKNEEIRKVYGINWKELEGLNWKMSGDVLQLTVTKTNGSFRMPKLAPQDLQKLLKETYNCLHAFEGAVREEFRKRTGKALTWKDPKEFADFSLVSMNGLYQFVAKKIGKVKTILPGQSFEKK